MFRLGVPGQCIALRLDRMVRYISFLLHACGRCLHAFDQTVRPHVGPMLVDECEASGTAVRFMNYGPTVRDLYKAWPKGMLSFVVDQNVVDAVFVFKWICHVVLH